MGQLEFDTTVQALMQTGKGILAMDESNPTCNKRFAKLGIPQTTEAHRLWRELILTTEGLGEFISGAILYDETIRPSKRRRHAVCQAPDRSWDCLGYQGGQRRQRTGQLSG